MKNLVPKLAILLIAVLFSFGCNSGTIRNFVDQKITTSYADGKGYLKTRVWMNGDIVWSIYDPIETLTDSIKLTRKRTADSIFNALKRIENL